MSCISLSLVRPHCVSQVIREAASRGALAILSIGMRGSCQAVFYTTVMVRSLANRSRTGEVPRRPPVCHQSASWRGNRRNAPFFSVQERAVWKSEFFGSSGGRSVSEGARRPPPGHLGASDVFTTRRPNRSPPRSRPRFALPPPACRPPSLLRPLHCRLRFLPLLRRPMTPSRL